MFFIYYYIKSCSKHVLSEDTVQREVKSGRLFTKRLLSKTNSIPKWAERFITAKHVHIIEESIVDPKNKMLITYTRNLGYAKVMVSFLEKTWNFLIIRCIAECNRKSCLQGERGTSR